MPSTSEAEKAALRADVKAFYQTGFDRQKSDRQLFARFLALPQVAGAASLLLFHGVGTEPDTTDLLQPLLTQGKTLALPRCLPGRRMEARSYLGPERMHPGPFGIPEPDDTCPVLKRPGIDLIWVPNLLCDRRGHRLGYGGGYYDRFLAGYSGLTIALCREALLQERIPNQPHDIPVDLIVTESQCLSRPGTARSGAFAPLLM